MHMLVTLQDEEELSDYEWVEGSAGVIDVLESWGVESTEIDDLLSNLVNHTIDSLHFPFTFPPFVRGTSKGTVVIFSRKENGE